MTTRLTLAALLFGIVGSASLAVAATYAPPAQPMKVVALERVVVVAQRLPAGQ